MSSISKTSLLSLIASILLGGAVVDTIWQMPTTQSAGNPATIVVPEEQAIITAVKKARPAVVSIVANKKVTVQPPIIFQFPNDFFNDPFFQLPRQQPQTQPREEEREVGSGTGFIVDPNGMIVTNNHVAGDPSATYKVILNDGRSLPGTIIATDPVNDIAVLKIAATGLPTIPLGNSDTIEIGQTVVAIGNSLGRYQNTVTRGVISGTGRNVVAGDNRGRAEELTNILQTDAAINPGNSGGPLVNSKGEAVGMNTATDLQGQSIGFAIPINVVKEVVTSVRTTGKIIRPWLGVRFVMITPEIKSQRQINVSDGALLVSGGSGEPAVIESSPAFRAGMREGDIIQTIDGEKLQSTKTLQSIIARHKVGDNLKLKVLRDGKTINVNVRLEQAP
ncbi:trypsin-like peptidase domain-containing protein [Candidatus Uhrbacteria bacterium]|nr:trypsin-like peptidase domain-containing protein [Candidatus Uhrbacteria bacterium]